MAKTGPRRDYGTGAVYQRCEARYACPPPAPVLNPETGEPALTPTGKPRLERPDHKCQARWYAEVDFGWKPNGNRDRRTVSASTEPQVKIKLRALLRAKEDGQTPAVSDRTTVKQIAEVWLPIAEDSMKAGAYRSTKGAVKNWIVPTIGEKRLTGLSPADWRAIDKRMREAGRLGSTRIRTHSTFMSLLKFAQAEGHNVPANVLAAKAPPKNETDRTDIPVPEAVQLLGLAAQMPQGSRWVTAFLEAMRQGECNGLTWDMVDFEAGTITVSWQLQALPLRVKYDRESGYVVPDGHEVRQLHGRWHLVRPKSERSWRVIPMISWVRTSLEAWREVAPANPHGLVWPLVDGRPCDPKIDDAEFVVMQETLGIAHPSGRHYTVHETRHTTATLLLEAGVPPEVIIAIMGHSSMLSTKAYLHVKTGPMADALDQVAHRLALSA
jgi:integrase